MRLRFHNSTKMKSKKILTAFRIIVALILIQTLRFKFTAHLDSVYIFRTISLEPFGRIGVGIAELIAGILLLIPKTAWLGALLSIGLMLGAVIMHLTILGIEIKNDGGILFTTAVITLLLSVVILFMERRMIIGRRTS